MTATEPLSRAEELPRSPAALAGDHAAVSVDAFWKAHPSARPEIIPPVPGVYVWTYNVLRLLGGDEKIAEDRLLNLLQIVGRNQQHKVGPYALVTVRDQRKEINPERSVILHERFAAEDEFGMWVAGLAVHVQRPLYVGKAINLHKRIMDHMRGLTPLKGYVEDRRYPDGRKEFECSMLDLVVTWYAAPRPPEGPGGRGTAGADEEVAADSEDADEGIVDDLAPDPIPVSPSPDLERWLYAAESLLIRLAMPMLNEVQS